MNHQFTFADGKFNGKRRKTRKDLFLARMDVLLPWEMMQEAIESVYHKAGNVRYPELWADHSLDVTVAPQPETDNYMTLEVSGNTLRLAAFLPDGKQIDKVEIKK